MSRFVKAAPLWKCLACFGEAKDIFMPAELHPSFSLGKGGTMWPPEEGAHPFSNPMNKGSQTNECHLPSPDSCFPSAVLSAPPSSLGAVTDVAIGSPIGLGSDSPGFCSFSEHTKYTRLPFSR